MMLPKISLIIPTFNAKDYLPRAINSLLDQSFGFENIELLLVDDNSTDGTQNIILDLANKYENVKPILCKENSGSPSQPRNIGVKHASADYVMFMDNDDIFFPEMCEVMYSTIIKYDADVVNCRHKVIDDYGNIIQEKSFLDKRELIINVEDVDEYPDIMSSGLTMLIWNKIFKKSVILDNKIEFPSEDLYEDVYFMSQVYLKAHGIVLLNDFWGYGYYIRTEGDNKSTSQNFLLKNLIKQFNGLRKIIKLLDNYDKKYPALEGGMIVGWTKLFILTNPNDEDKRVLLNKAKPIYEHYKISYRLIRVNILLNVFINIFIKIFSSNIRIAIFLTNFYNKLKNL